MTAANSLLTDDDQIALLALWRCPQVGPVHFRRIVSKLSEPSQILDPALAKDITHLLPAAAKDQLTSNKLRTGLIAKAEADWQWGNRLGQNLLFEQNSDYPEHLKNFSDSPPLLFAKGALECLSLPQVAVVGTRNPTVYGREQTNNFTQSLVKFGFSITSGLALGIDALAHEVALMAEGKTVAVLAHGLDQVYPRSHWQLAKRIVDQHGLLISEFPLETGPRKHHFPRRNRIMSALSIGILVIEAAVRSGSLITARLASAQGKEVFALPGSVKNIFSQGCHQLIREGAVLVENVKDIIEVIEPLMQRELKHASLSCDQSNVVTPDRTEIHRDVDLLNPIQRQIYEALDFEASTIDTLVLRTQLSPQAILTQLMVMELKALVRTVPGGYSKI